MRTYIKKLLVSSLTALFLSAQAVPSFAMAPILTHDQVKEGMTGTAYTVIDSSGELRDFQVDIIGLVDNGKGSQPMIMAKASGPVIEQTGGILQGMSGSPVYVNGCLIGAVAAGIKEMTPYTFFITPIDEMTPLWKMPDCKNKTRIHTIDIKKAAEDAAKAKAEKEKKIKEREASGDKDTVYGDELVDRARAAVAAEKEAAAEPAKEEPQDQEAAAAEAEPAVEAEPDAESADDTEPAAEAVQAEPKDVMFFSGFNQAGLDFLQKQLDPQGTMEFLPMGAAVQGDSKKTVYNASLVPGSAVGVAVAYGDFAVGATGTVTAVDGKKILAFGHPFLHRGNVNYFMTDAKVVGTISGQSNGMKIASIGNIIGRVNQDRATGIAGVLGQFPAVVPIKVKVTDKSLGRAVNYSARIAYDEDFLAQLSGGIAYAALSKTADDLSAGTAEVGFTIRTDAVTNGKVERKNMFYNAADVGQVAMAELMQAMNVISQNKEKESDIIDVQVNIDVDSSRKTASLVSAIPDKKKVKPGETVKFTTTIKPYRKAKETIVIPFTVPETQPSGVMSLDIRGGGLVPATALMMLQQSGVDVITEDDSKQTTEDKLRKLQESGRNNEVIIAPSQMQKQVSPSAQRRAIREAQNKAHKVDLLGTQGKDKPGKTNFATNYIIDNVIHSTLTIERN
ncbi:SpoIVB peptidase S55 [Selenomonas sp. GACV-9]|uniref:SpoIVB peptidase S55 domain-containing protein n=1 Tax=Selenomonas sp. GACV-9 TaxID=3158782 RepID=UPI0008F15A77|nr:SpoIVB peptidase S55 [Selenomonas ruminantium]